MKIAISVPDPIFEAAERLAKQRSVPRSRIFSEALEAYLEVQGPDAITAKLNQVYAQKSSELNPDLEKAQFNTLNHEAW
jgi:metal-responsive CopG/Arc/MetJ family transcriptional regulator